MNLSILNNILSPQNGVAIMGIVAVWSTTKFESSAFKYWLLVFALICAAGAIVGDILHQNINNSNTKKAIPDQKNKGS